MAELIKPDICVIGGGSGGLTVAAAAAALGVPVVLVERGKMGGDCLNYGCVPSKSLLAAAKQAHRLSHGAAFGIADATPQVDFAAVMRHVEGVIAEIAPHDSVERFTALGVKVIQAEARFTDRHTVRAGDYAIRARRFVVATGSRPAIPPVPGLDEVAYLTNETVFSLKRRPEHLIVIGGGPIGVELGQAYRRLGARVSIVEAADALGRDDPELRAVVLDQLRADGVELLEHTRVARVEKRGRAGIRVHLEGPDGARMLDGSHLLVAAGRKPNVESLALDEAGIAHDARGIEVARSLRTTNRRVYAIGDVAGGLQFTHLANHHAGLVIRAVVFRLPVREDPLLIPRVTYTEPELAHIGLTEAEARARNGRVSVLRSPYAQNDRARTERRTEGQIKLVAGRGGRILGVSIVGEAAGEMIDFWSLALSRRMRIRDIISHIAPYPTFSEIGKRAALSHYTETARKPAIRGLIRFLRVFG